jgi:[acyl-carrier-protein] S-malonyltransferase
MLGLSDEDVRAACAEAAAAVPGEIVEAVNYNAPAQVVVAGHTAAVDKACEIAKAKGAKRAMRLPVSAPFHSSLLKPASDRLREYMASIHFSAPQIPLINNVDVAVLNDPASIKDALVRQAASPVRWVETMQKVAAEGITNVVECGPGKVLMGLAKRIDPVLVGEAIYDQATLERMLETLK